MTFARPSTCCPSLHALAESVRRNGASVAIRPSVLPLARMHRPQGRRPGLCPERLVQKAELDPEDSPLPMPGLQEVVLALDVLGNLLPEAARVVAGGRRRPRRVFRS